MSTWEITKSFEFSAAHTIVGHPKCGRMHGHNYKVTICLAATELDDEGMVLDYGRLSAVMKNLIETLDHRFLESMSNRQDSDSFYLQDMPEDQAVGMGIWQTTAELLAEWIYKHLRKRKEIPASIDIMYVEVSETPKTTARFYP